MKILNKCDDGMEVEIELFEINSDDCFIKNRKGITKEAIMKSKYDKYKVPIIYDQENNDGNKNYKVVGYIGDYVDRRFDGNKFIVKAFIIKPTFCQMNDGKLHNIYDLDETALDYLIGSVEITAYDSHDNADGVNIVDEFTLNAIVLMDKKYYL